MSSLRDDDLSVYLDPDYEGRLAAYRAALPHEKYRWSRRRF